MNQNNIQQHSDGDAAAETAAADADLSCKYRLTGVVQNVGFRHHLQKAAAECGVQGWAKNECDGSLIVFMCGQKDAVSQFMLSLQGPTSAQVSNMSELLIEAEDDCPAAFESR